MNAVSNIAVNKEAYQKLHDEVQVVLNWISNAPEISKFEVVSSEELEHYRHTLMAEFCKARDIVKNAQHNAEFAQRQSRNVGTPENKEICLGKIFAGLILGKQVDESFDEATELGQKLITSACEVAADEYQTITGFRPEVPSNS